MGLFSFAAGVFLVLAPVSMVNSQDPTKTYTYDDLGRLTKVEIDNGSQDGEQRDYSYDRADNRQSVVSTGASSSPPQSCTLGPVGFTTTQSGNAYPRVYAPTSAGCGFQIKLDFTITLESGQVSASELQAIENAAVFFPGGDDTLEADEHAKILVVLPTTGVVSTTQPFVLRVNWIAPDGNATFGGSGYSLVTINPN
ncbi:MAG: RHS repeat domain-containing protein [Pseudomonadota bacterium]